jgi:WD40-like Beta Propeller Repeat
MRKNHIDFPLYATDPFRPENSMDFSEDFPIYLIHGESIDSAGVSLRDYDGNQLWLSKPEGVEWACFRHHSSRVVVARWPNLTATSEKPPDHEIEILDLDANGKPIPPSRVVPASQFDYSLLDGPQLRDLGFTLGSSLRLKNPSLIGEYGCGRVIANSNAGLVFCAQNDRAPILFDLATQRPVGPLKGWSFGNVMEDPVFSPDGKTLVVASDQSWLTAWDTTTGQSRWQFKGNIVGYEFSSHGKRVVAPTHVGGVTSAEALLEVLDEQTGMSIAALPTQKWNAPAWMNPTGTRIFTREPEASNDKGNEGLILWDVDNSTPIWKTELKADDKAEVAQDLLSLEKNPAIPDLLKIAYRRLRTCNNSGSPTQ